MSEEKKGVALRLEAVDILCESEKKNVFVNTVLRNHLNRTEIADVRDRAFINRLCLGTASMRIALDFALSQYVRNGMEDQRPIVRQILRAGAYELLFMDVPDRAVVNSYVSVAGEKGFEGVKSFINAVLRNLSANKYEIPWPDAETRYSMPAYPGSLIRAFVGDDKAPGVFRALSEKDNLSVKVYNRQFFSEEQTGWKKNPLHRDVYDVQGGGDVKDYPGYEEGAFVVQDPSSVLAVEALHLKGKERVLDLCSAPGGKSCLAASFLDKGGTVRACDVNGRRLTTVSENARRLGLTNITVEEQDASKLNVDHLDAYDAVIADIPCSGLGVSGRKSDVKFRVSEESIRELTELQRNILGNAAKYVKSGGKLLLSTCTLTLAENTENAKYLTGKHGFDILDERTFIPGEDPCDGFYYCVLRRP